MHIHGNKNHSSTEKLLVLLRLIPYGIYRLIPLFIFPTLITLMMLENSFIHFFLEL